MRRVAYFITLAFLILILHFKAFVAPAMGSRLEKEKSRVITAAVLEDFPPLYKLDVEGRPSGFAVEILEQVAAKANFKLKYLVVENWGTAMQAVRHGSADLIPGIGISPTRSAEFAFSEKIETIPVSCFVRSKNYSINNIDELAGHKVAVIDQSAAQTRLASRPDLRLMPQPNIDSALMNLLAGEVDAFVFPEPVLRKKARQAGVADKIKVVGKPLMELKRGFLLRKNDTRLLELLNPIIEKYNHSDDYLKHYVKWYGKPEPFWNGERTFWFMSVFMFMSLFVMLIWRNYSVTRINRELLDSIEQRKKVETALRESENLYRALIDNIDLGITYISSDHQVIIANAAHGRLLKKSPRELVGKICFQEFEKREEICPHCPGVLALETAQAQEVISEGMRDDGSTLMVRIKAFPVFSDVEGKRGFIEVVEDITEKIKIEQALKENEALLQSIFKSAPIGVGLVVDRIFAWTNQKITEISGYEESELKGKQSRMLYPDDAEFEWVGREKYEQIRKYGTGSVETKWKRKDGRIIDVLLSSTPIDADDLAEGVTFSALDITARKKAQRELSAEKENLAVTLRSIGDGVITTDIQGNIVLVNRVAEKLTGWPQEEAVGKPLSEVFHIVNEKTRDTCENPVHKVLESGRIIGLANHTSLISRHGVERSIADSGAPIRDSDSNIIGVVLVFRDVTEKRRMEEEILKGKKLESVGVLAGGIAHDFNNILTAILGNINMVTHSMDPAEENCELLKEAEKASLRARDLTKQLLTFSKGGDPVLETASLGQVIRESADFILHGEKVGCRYAIPDDLWLVEVDKGQLSQVIQNLIINAVDAMPEGGLVRIECENVNSADQEIPPSFIGNYVKITIADTGIGIPENVIEKIFDPYFSTKQEGSGLGLAITHAIIAKHDGHVFVDSEPGVGTRFTIYLPVTDKTLPDEKTDFFESRKLGKGKILVMDDEAMVLKLADKMLTKLGHTVVLATNGEEAIALFEEHAKAKDPFDLVIMDLTIPGGMGGRPAVRGILAVDPEAKVVVSSGYSTDAVMANFADYGFSEAMTKPFQMSELMRILELFLN